MCKRGDGRVFQVGVSGPVLPGRIIKRDGTFEIIARIGKFAQKRQRHPYSQVGLEPRLSSSGLRQAQQLHTHFVRAAQLGPGERENHFSTSAENLPCSFLSSSQLESTIYKLSILYYVTLRAIG